MGQLLHGSARPTAALPRAIQQSQERLATLAERSHLTPKTVAKWTNRTPGQEAPLGPQPPRSTTLTLAPEARVGACRQPPLRPLDDGLAALPATLPHRTRAALPRGLTRHGMHHLPEMTGDTPQQKTLQSSPIGYCPIDLAEVRTAEGPLPLCVALARTSQFACAE
jgi:hypothetical protein